MKKNLLLITLCFFVFSCKKEASEVKKSETTPKITIQEAKDFLNDLPNLQTNSQNESSFDAKSLLEKIDWKNASQIDSGKALIGKFEGQPTENGVKIGFRKALFIKDKFGKTDLLILEFIPDILHLWKYNGIKADSYDGKLFVYDKKYKLKKGFVYRRGKLYEDINPTQQNQLQVSSQIKTNSVSCTNTFFAYYNALGYLEGGIRTSCITNLDPTFPSFAPISETAGLGAGGTVTGPNGEPIIGIVNIPNLYFPGQGNPSIDIKKFINCFGTTDELNASYEFSVYVDQPENGSNSSSYGGDVGHAFIGIKKTTSSGSFTQYIGFYPEGDFSGIMPLGQKFVNNQNYPYDVSITFNIPFNSFQSLLNAANNYDKNYNIWTNNCTNFALDMANAANVYVPNSQGNSFISRMPGQLGEDLRQYKREWGPGIGVNDAGGETGQSKGPCN